MAVNPAALSLRVLALLAILPGCASRSGNRPAVRPETASPASQRLAPESLERARVLFAEARSAKEGKDPALAREKAAAAIDALLSAIDEVDAEAATNLLVDLGTFAQVTGDLRAAERARRRVFELRASTLPDDHPELQRARGDFAVTIKALGDLQGARALEEKVLEVSMRTLPEDDPAVQRARQNLAGTIARLGEERSALALFQQVLESRTRTLPEEHPDLLQARLNVAVALAEVGELQEACELTERVLAEGSQVLPEDHPDLDRARMNLGRTLRELGRHAEANALDRSVVEVRARTLPADHPDLALARLNLGVSTFSLGDLAGARSLFEQVVDVFSRTLPEDHPDLQKARNNLALTLRELGELQAARVLQERVLESRSRTLPADHRSLQIARLNLGATATSLGDMAGARAFFEAAVEHLSRTVPEDHPELQTARLNLTLTLCRLGDHAGARALNEEALAILLRTRPENDVMVQRARSFLAEISAALGDLQTARTLEEQALEALANTLPEDHPDLHAARSNLASTLRQMGELEAARALDEQVLADCERSLPDGHPRLRIARGNLALTLLDLCAREAGGAVEVGARERADLARAVELLTALSSAQVHAAREIQLSSPAREAEERCTTLAGSLDTVLSAALGYGAIGPLRELEDAAFAYSEAVRNAGLLAGSLARAAADSPPQALLRSRLRESSAELASLARAGTSSADYRAAVQARDQLERELMALSGERRGDEGAWVFDARAVSDRLERDCVVVAYRRYSRTRPPPARSMEPGPASSDVQSLCAFVLRSGAAVTNEDEEPLVLLDLGSIQPIERAVGAWRDAQGASAGRGVGVETLAARGDARMRGEAVRALVFDPLRDALLGARRVVLLLDDVLHLVPFDALPDQSEDAGGRELLGERYRFEPRAALSELLLPAPGEPLGGLLALGGADFDGEPVGPRAESALLAAASPRADGRRPALLRGSAWEQGFSRLEQTGPEARGLAELYARAVGGGDEFVLEGARASRESLEALAPGARWLHVATHGWYAPESIRSWEDPEPLDAHTGLGSRRKGEEEVRGSSPMLLCGLALAGANLAEDALGRAPGLMTAEELSTLDLSGCEMAVLSACDTNVGERRAGQGVASLQRALQMAGARTVVTSLWKVPDEATRELMTEFYRRVWVEKKPKGQALWEAKMMVRAAVDEAGRPRYSTRDWAAWVLTGDPG